MPSLHREIAPSHTELIPHLRETVDDHHEMTPDRAKMILHRREMAPGHKKIVPGLREMVDDHAEIIPRLFPS